MLLLIVACAPAAGAEPVSRVIDFSEAPGAVMIADDGAEVRLEPIREDRAEGWINVAASIRVPGYRPISVSEGAPTSPVYPRVIGIGRLSATDSAPSVLLAGYSGGAHCCATLKAIVPDAGQLRVLEFPAVDGEPDESFPRDVDGDGIVDIVRQDDTFRYQFSGGAGSFSPPVIYNIRGGQILDVSAQPRFRPLWQQYARETRAHCAERSNDDRNGAGAA